MLPDLLRAGGTLVGLTPETGGRAAAMKRDHTLHYEILVDVDLAVAMAFGIVFQMPPLYVELLQRRGVDLPERSGLPGWLLPVPATFLAGQDGIVLQAWVNRDFTQRAEPSDIVSALQGLQILKAL